MDFWKWFSSERRVLEALKQSTGYDISPQEPVQPPANQNTTPKKRADGTEELSLWTDYDYTPDAPEKEPELWGDSSSKKVWR